MESGYLINVKPNLHSRTFDNLPINAQSYIMRIEEIVGVPVDWIGVGAGREAMVSKSKRSMRTE
jgi:adenylosuccinate synthase